MADGAVLLARGVYDIGLKIGIRTLLKKKSHRLKHAGRVSFLSAGFLLDNFGNTNGNEAKRVSDLARDTYTRVTPVVLAQDTQNQRELRISHKLKRISQIHRCHEARYSKFNLINVVFVRAYSGNGGGYQEPLYRSKTAYYDILGVSGNATHAQIKTAYYKQSFAYHPDRNAGSDEATLRFSEINEAYTVLGNKALRKKYDRGLLSSSDLIATARPSTKDTPTASSTKRQTYRQRSVMDPDGSGRVFDFDKFFKAHYGEQLQRERDLRVRQAELQKKKEKGIGEQTMDGKMELGLGLLLLMAIGVFVSLKRG